METPNDRLPSTHKVAIIGAGSVGSAIASSLLFRPIAGEIILVDVDSDLCHAQVQDLSDAASLSNAQIRQGNHKDAGQSDVIVVSAGAKQRPGDSRLDLISRNHRILKSVIESMQPLRRDAILVLVANPVDALTYYAQKLSGLPRSQVLGSGTALDSVRLQGLLSQKLQVAASAIQVHVLGEHGDSQFVAWSAAAVAGSPLNAIHKFDDAERSAMATATKEKAYNIIKVKGFTSCGIAAVVSTICESIFFNQRRVLSLSHWQDDLNCCLSLPAVLGAGGISSSIALSLNESERGLLEESATSMRKVIAECDASTVGE